MSAVVDPLVLARKGDRYRTDGDLDTCDRCGVMIRRLRTLKGRLVEVAPYPMPGNWLRPLHGYGPERADGKKPETYGLLYVLPVSPARAAAAGWNGGATVFLNPPTTVWGYRPHHADCPPDSHDGHDSDGR